MYGLPTSGGTMRFVTGEEMGRQRPNDFIDYQSIEDKLNE